MKKIDIHCHTSNRNIQGTVDSNATVKSITEKARIYNIDKVVLLATYFPHKESGISNFRLYDWIRNINLNNCPKGPEFLMFGSLDFEHYFFQGYNELKELAERQLIKGIKIYTCYQNIDIKSNKFKTILQLARDFKLPVMFHAGYSYATRRKYGQDTIATPYNAMTLESVAKDNEDITMIFSHMSKPFFHDILRVVKEVPNVYTDMSGLIDSKYDEEEIPVCIQEIRTLTQYEWGIDKLLFGTDYPVQTHEHSIYFVEEATEGYSHREKIIKDIYFNNAAKILKLDERI